MAFYMIYDMILESHLAETLRSSQKPLFGKIACTSCINTVSFACLCASLFKRRFKSLNVGGVARVVELKLKPFMVEAFKPFSRN